MIRIQKTIYVISVCLSLVRIAPAAPFWFSQKAGAGSGSSLAGDLLLNNGHVITNLNSGELICTRTQAGAGLLYSMDWTGNDFNGDGTNDTLSFELRVEGFKGSTYTYNTSSFESSMTALGATSDVTAINNTWGVGGDADVDAGQSLRFSVTNVQVSVPGWTGTFGGFTGTRVLEPNGGREHRLILGAGTALDGKEFDTPTATYSFPAADPLVLTGAGSMYAGTREWAVAGIDFTFNVSNPTQPSTWDVTDYSEFATGPGYLDEYSAQNSFSNYPSFFWNTVPRWLIVRKGTAYTQAEIETMATNYEVIVFEKANTAGFTSTEAGIHDAATRVRAVDPTTKNLFYWNSYIHYPSYAANALYKPNAWEWSNHTTDSNGTEIIYLLKDKYYTYNYSVPEMRDWWVETALNMVTNEVIDGVFIDKVHEIRGTLFEDGVPASDHLSMLLALEEQLPEGKLHTGNTLRNSRKNGNRSYMEFMEGSYLEGWSTPDPDSTPAQSSADAVAVSIQLMREALAKGKFIMFKTGGNTISKETLEASVKYPLALFLIIAETNAYFSYQGSVDAMQAAWLWDTSYVPEFSYPLGRPLADPVRDGYVYTRSFEHVDVRVDISTRMVTLAWDCLDTDADGMPDLWEYRNFSGTTQAVATGNPDGDAYTNLEEYIAGLDPNAPDTLGIMNVYPGRGPAFGWKPVSGRVYNVYWSSNLLDGFTLIGSNVPNGVFVDDEHAGKPMGFYRFTIQPSTDDDLQAPPGEEP